MDSLLPSVFAAKEFTAARLVKAFNHLIAATLATAPIAALAK